MSNLWDLARSSMSNFIVLDVQFNSFKFIMFNLGSRVFNLKVFGLPCLIVIIISMFVDFNHVLM
jgi:hypothetical protein